jgi:hypothetical protein
MAPPAVPVVIASPTTKTASKSFVPVFFKDFGKAVNDILKPSKYDLGKQIEVKTKSKNDVSFTASSTLLDDDAPGKLVIKSKVCKSTDFEGELHTSGKFIGKVTSEKLAEGLKIIASNECVPSKGSSLHLVEAFYSTSNVAVSATATSNLLKDYKVDAALVLGYDGVSFGGQGTYKDNAFTDYNVGAEYAHEDFKLTVKTANKADKVVASYSHVVSPAVTVVGSFAYDLGKATPGKEFSIGSAYKLDDTSSVTSTYVTKGASGVLSALYEVKVQPTTTLSLGTVVDLHDTSRQKFGIKLTLG